MTPRQRLWDLLPSVHRQRDAGSGQLRAYLELLDAQLDEVEAEIEGLYEDWFVETCEPSLLAYVGDLLAVRPLQGLGEAHDGRAWVANALRLRRRKGTATMLEQLALDVTGWPARAFESFQTLSWTQNLNHVRKGRGGTVDVRDAVALERLGGPFETAPRLVDVRPPASDPGRHNVPNVMVHLYRARAFAVKRSDAREITHAEGSATVHDGWTFDPLGRDVALYAPGRAEKDVASLAQPAEVPAPLGPFALAAELAARRVAAAGGPSAGEPEWFGDEPVLKVWLDGAPVPPEEMVICDLRAWRTPANALPPGPPGAPPAPIKVAVDPARGRLTTSVSPKPAVRVSWHRGAAGALGGGPYDRAGFLPRARLRPATWQRGVSRDPAEQDAEVFATLAEAIAAWNAAPAGAVGVITLADDRTYAETSLPEVRVPAGSQLAILGARWPKLPSPAGPLTRVPGRIAAEGVRPHVRGGLRFVGVDGVADALPGEVVLDGILLEGGVTVGPGDLGRLRVSHATLAAPGSLRVETAGALDNADLEVEVERAFVGPVQIGGPARLAVTDSVLDGVGGPALSAPDTFAALASATLLGPSGVQRIEASDCVFDGLLQVARRQEGCVRYSWLPPASKAPRRYRCQPDLALKERVCETEAQVLRRVVPRFASRNGAHARYARLADDAAREVLEGSEGGDEMGAFGFLRDARRLADLRRELADHLPLGLDPGILFET